MSIYEALLVELEDLEPTPSRVKLSVEDVADIRRLYRGSGWTQQEIADQFGVTQPQISKIVNNLQWKEQA